MLASALRASRLTAKITVVNFRASLAYRGDFLMAVLMGLAWQTSVLVFAGVLLTRFPGLGGWTQGGILLIASMRLLSHGGYVATFGNLFMLPFWVAEGMIDGFLLRPMPVYRQVLLAKFPMNAVGDSTAACVLFGLAMSRLHLAWTPTTIAYLVSGVVGGVFAEGAMLTAVSATAFRFTGGWPLYQWVDNLAGTFGNYPQKILPVAARTLLTFGLPIAFIAYLPATVITGKVHGSGVPAWIAIGSPAAGPLLFVASRLLWNWALRRYEAIGG